MNAEQYEFFRKNGYLVITGLLKKEVVASVLEMYERDRREYPQMWVPYGSQTVNCDSLLTSPDFDSIIRHPGVLREVEDLMGGSPCLGEICIRHMAPYTGESPKRGWHRDKPHWVEHPLRMDFIQLMLYLTDVHEGTHCFSISPESADEKLLDRDAQLERGGIVDFHGPIGTLILFNVSNFHTATVRETHQERKSVQIYYGHRHRPYLSNCTVVPESLWRDHPDPEARAFYNKLNRKTNRYLAARAEENLQDADSIFEWCLDYDQNVKRSDNAARPEGDEDAPAARGQEHGTEGE